MHHLPLFLCLAIGAFLSLYKLDDVFLWADEGETLILAKNILQWGMPKYFNDTYSLCPTMGITPDGLWTGQPWLQFYWVALFMKVFGDSIFFLRLPFVLAFLGSISLMWTLGKRLGWPRMATGVSTFLLATCVPLILASRNVRYYSLLPFFSLGLCVLYFDLQQGRDKRWIAFGLVSTLFIHTMQPVAAAVVGTFLLHALLVERNKKLFWALVKSQLLMLVLFLPWLFYVWPGLIEFYRQRASSTLGRNLTLGSFIFGIGFYLITMIHGSFPLLLTPFLCVKKTRNNCPLERAQVLLFGMLILVICSMMSFIFNSNLFPGYVLATLPFLILLATSVIFGVSRGKKPIVLGMTMVVVLSTLFNLPSLPGPIFDVPPTAGKNMQRAKVMANLLLSQPLELPLVYYSGELANSYKGPVETLVEFLKDHAKPGDRFFASNDGHSIHFATGLGRVNEVPFPFPPNWIIQRGQFPLSRNTCKVDPAIPNADEYIAHFISTHPYEAVTLDVANLYHENVPVMPFHLFLMPSANSAQEKLVVLHLKQPYQKKP